MKKIIIDYNKHCIRAAVLEGTELVEIIIEDRQKLSLIGNIYTGIIKNILPSQFAFIDIGTGKNAFLHLNDIKESKLYDDQQNLNLKCGDSIIVQVTKDATGTKAACVTSQLSFTGKHIVLIRNESSCNEIGISKKIVDKKERDRLKKIASKLLKKDCGIIMRTSCENMPFDKLKAEIDELFETSEDILSRAEFIKAPAIIYGESHITLKIVKELFREDIDEIIVNNKEDYNTLKTCNFLGENIKIEYYQNQDKHIFDQYNIDNQMMKALQKRVWLKSGGFIIIEQTEACVVIDVNTGKFTGKTNHENTVSKINFEAVLEIAKQIQLRNLSGIIIVDFIGMKGGYDTLIKTMQKELDKARIRSNVIGMTGLDLMEITRKKSREPLSSIITNPCIYNSSINEKYLSKID